MRRKSCHGDFDAVIATQQRRLRLATSPTLFPAARRYEYAYAYFALPPRDISLSVAMLAVGYNRRELLGFARKRHAFTAAPPRVARRYDVGPDIDDAAPSPPGFGLRDVAAATASPERHAAKPRWLPRWSIEVVCDFRASLLPPDARDAFIASMLFRTHYARDDAARRLPAMMPITDAAAIAAP